MATPIKPASIQDLSASATNPSSQENPALLRIALLASQSQTALFSDLLEPARPLVRPREDDEDTLSPSQIKRLRPLDAPAASRNLFAFAATAQQPTPLAVAVATPSSPLFGFPPTGRKSCPPVQRRKEEPNGLRRLALDLNRTREFTWDRHVFKRPPELQLNGDTADYSTIFTIESEGRPYVIKLFRPNRIEEKSNRAVELMFAHQFKNYSLIRETPIPCATLRNDPRVDGFSVYDFIPDKLEIPLKDSPIQQIKQIIATIYEQQLLVDLRIRNLKVQGGTITLVDFMEEADEDDWLVFLKKGALELSGGNRTVLETICPAGLLREIERDDAANARHPKQFPL